MDRWIPLFRIAIFLLFYWIRSIVRAAIHDYIILRKDGCANNIVRRSRQGRQLLYLKISFRKADIVPWWWIMDHVTSPVLYCCNGTMEQRKNLKDTSPTWEKEEVYSWSVLQKDVMCSIDSTPARMQYILIYSCVSGMLTHQRCCLLFVIVCLLHDDDQLMK